MKCFWRSSKAASADGMESLIGLPSEAVHIMMPWAWEAGSWAGKAGPGGEHLAPRAGKADPGDAELVPGAGKAGPGGEGPGPGAGEAGPGGNNPGPRAGEAAPCSEDPGPRAGEAAPGAARAARAALLTTAAGGRLPDSPAYGFGGDELQLEGRAGGDDMGGGGRDAPEGGFGLLSPGGGRDGRSMRGAIETTTS
jgi:hypothetical protein